MLLARLDSLLYLWLQDYSHELAPESCVPTLGSKELRVLQLRGVSSRLLGVRVARVHVDQLNCEGYFVVDILDSGTAAR